MKSIPIEQISKIPGMIVLILDIKGNITFINKSGEEILEYKEGELIGKNWFEKCLPEQRKKEIKEIFKKLILGEVESADHVASIVLTKTKKEKMIAWYNTSLQDDEKSTIGTLSFGTDITEQKQVEESFKENEQRLKDAQALGKIGYWEFDLINHKISWSEQVFKLYNRDISLGPPSFEEEANYYSPEVAERLKEYAHRAIEFGEEFNYDFDIIWHKKNIVHLTSLMHPIKDEGEKVIKLVGTVQDISERKLAEQKLRESEEKFRTISDESHLGICILQDDVIKYTNKKLADLYGYTIEEVYNLGPGGFLNSIAPDSLELVLEQARKKQIGNPDIVVQYPVHCVKQSGELFWVDNISKTIMYNGRPADLITSIDITGKKEAEQKLRESEEASRKAYNQVNFYKDLFTHDIKNIINAINGSVQLFTLYQDNIKKTNERNALINIIKDQVMKGILLISNVRKISELEENAEKIIEEIEVMSVLKDAMKFIEESFQERRIDMSIENFIKKPKVLANDLLLDVFTNIMNNAVKYNENTIVEIIIRISEEKIESNEYIKLEFLDNGIGVLDENKNHIFKKGYKGIKGTKGMGLGLTLILRLIENYKGRIWVEDKVPDDYSKGSNFIILIPKSS